MYWDSGGLAGTGYGFLGRVRRFAVGVVGSCYVSSLDLNSNPAFLSSEDAMDVDAAYTAA